MSDEPEAKAFRRQAWEAAEQKYVSETAKEQNMARSKDNNLEANAQAKADAQAQAVANQSQQPESQSEPVRQAANGQEQDSKKAREKAAREAELRTMFAQYHQLEQQQESQEQERAQDGPEFDR